MPSRYELLCEEHTYANVARERVRRRTEAREKRQRQREESAEEVDDEDEEEEEPEAENEDDEEEDKDEEKDKDYDEEDEDMVAPRRKPGPGKRRATAPHGRRSGPIALFMSDQSESEGEGMANKVRKEVKLEPMDEDPRPSDNIKTTAGLSVRGRLEAKQRKVEQARLNSNGTTNGNNSKKPVLALDPKPATVIPSPPAPKQKLPNKAHLHSNPVSARPPSTANGFKRPSAPVIRDLDEVSSKRMKSKNIYAKCMCVLMVFFL